jgi:hypothetical protein
MSLTSKKASNSLSLQPLIIYSVLAPAAFDRTSLKPSAPASERLAFPSATPVASLLFSSVSFFGDLETYSTTAELLRTLKAVPTVAANATTTPAIATPTSSSTGTPAEFPGTGSGAVPGAIAALMGAVGVAVALV